MNRVITTGLAALSGAMLSLSTIPAVAATSDRPKVGDVQAAMTELAKSPSIVGAIGEVYVDGKLAGKGTAGSRLINGKGGKIPSNSRYRLGSQTKQMTGVVILQLVKEGQAQARRQTQ